MHPYSPAESTPEPRHPHPRMTDAEAAATARRIIADAIQPTADTPIATAFRDPSPLPEHGSTPPVPQPGTPPMSQKAVDISRLMLTAGLATVPPGLIAVGLLIASEHADPTVIGMLCAAPAAVAVPILAITRLLSRAKDAAPDVHHHHYAGPVTQQHTTQTSHTRGLIARTHNDTHH